MDLLTVVLLQQAFLNLNISRRLDVAFCKLPGAQMGFRAPQRFGVFVLVTIFISNCRK